MDLYIYRLAALIKNGRMCQGGCITHSRSVTEGS